MQELLKTQEPSLMDKKASDVKKFNEIVKKLEKAEETGEYPVETKKEEPKKEEVKEEKKEEVLPTESKAKIVSLPPKEEKKEIKEEDDFSKKFAALSRRERFLSQKEKEARDQLKDLEELKNFKKSFESDPFGTLEKLGHTYEAWTKKILSGEVGVTPTKEVEELKKEVELLKTKEVKKQEDNVNQKRMETYAYELKNIENFMTENKGTFPLVNFYGDHQLIFDIRAEKFNQDSKEYGQEYAKENLMSVEEAAKLAEDYRKEFYNQRKDMLKSIQDLPKEESQPKKAEETQPQMTSSPQGSLPERTRKLLGMKTLSNKQQMTPTKEAKKFKTDKERLEHAAQFLRYSSE